MLCGLKSDLRHKRTCIELLKTQGLTPVTSQQGRAVADKMGAMYMECSSKEMNGVHEIFDTAIDVTVRGQDEQVAEQVRGSSKAGATSGARGGAAGVPAKKKKKSACKIL